MPLSSAALAPLLRLAVVPGIGPARLDALIRHFGSATRVLGATAAEVARVPGFGPELVRRVCRAAEPEGERRGEAALALLQRHRAVAMTPDDLEYPDAFRLLADPPYLLYARGDLALLRHPMVAMVGTRKPSAYGERAAADLSRGLVEAGYGVASGMAAGIDAAAHRAALDADGGTIGVLGNGIERVYPASNRALFRDVAERGLLLTEFPPGEEPNAGNFPRRNRLVAALSLGVVVVEMAIRSGARHTVDFALDLGREVFAVPGPIGSEVSAGTNQLIKQGAAVVTSVRDVVDVLEGVGAREARGPAPGPAPSARAVHAPDLFDLPDEAVRVLRALDGEPRHVDELAASADLPAGALLALLLELELKGAVEALPGKLYRKA